MARSRRWLPLVVVLATMAACGDGNDTASDPGPSPTTPAGLEAITHQGVAAVVREVVGADRIDTFSAAGEEDSVGALARLSHGRHVLVVTVQVSGDPPIDSCGDLADTAAGSGDCTVEADGTIVASNTGGPFSDDNRKGSTALAQAVNPETGRVVLALYETYSPTPALDPRTLATIVADPRLAAMTDPATNEAGADIVLEGASG
jgi:hypothetical protein